MYASLFGMINIQILNCHGIFGHRTFVGQFSPAEGHNFMGKYLNIFVPKLMYKKICLTMRGLTFRSLICDSMNTGGVASQDVRRSSFFSTLSTALRQIFAVSKIGHREVILYIPTHRFPAHHFLVGQWSNT